MATNANIGIANDDGSIISIYVHFDAYPQYVGKTLLNSYTNFNKINELMELGDLSSLGEELFLEGHCWKAPMEGVCVAYGRDKGESNVESKRFNNEIEYMMNNAEVDYQYLFKNNNWYYRRAYNDDSKFIELTKQECQKQ